MDAITKNNFHASIKESVFSSLMIGGGEQFFCAFMIALGISNQRAGLLSIIPLVIGSFLQLLSPTALKWFGSYRKWTIFCFLSQAVMFIPLIILAEKNIQSFWIPIGIISLYWAFSLSSTNAWNVWIATLIPNEMRKNFLAKRGQVSQAFTLVGLVFAGSLLEFGKEHQYTLKIFSLIFFLAFIFKFISAYYLAAQSDLEVPKAFSSQINVKEFLSDLFKTHYGVLFCFLFFFYFMVQISSPYFSPFMLGKLNLNYIDYMILIASAFIARSFTYSLLGSWLKKIPNHYLFCLSVIGIVPLPFLWTISHDFVFLIFVQMISGAVWASFELANLLLIMEIVPDIHRSRTLATFHVFNHGMYLLGAILGAYLIDQFGDSVEGYEGLFLLGTLCRVAALGLLPSFFFRIRKHYRLGF
jgi:hypothetical protein